VRLVVALVDHPQAVGVAEFEEVRVRRVVAGADRVDVVPLHQQHVLEQGLAGERAPGARVPFVPVDAAEQDRAAVDEDPAVDDLDVPEADAQRHALAVGDEFALVQARGLIGPGLDRERERTGRVDVHEAEFGDGEPGGRRGGLDAQRAGAGRVVVVGVHEEVLEPAREQPDRAEDPGHPPHVLVFEVAAAGPLVHPHRDHVPPRPQRPGGVELGGQPAARAVAEPDPVDPHRETRVHALEAQHGAVEREVLGELELAPVLAGRVGVGHARRVDREGVVDVRVGGPAVAVQLPERRDGQLVPAGIGEVGLVEAGGRSPRPAARRKRQLPSSSTAGTSEAKRARGRSRSCPGEVDST
jgi:hypothetical protein